MKRMIESITGNYSASASVVDGTLILSLPDALTPVIWRLELGQARASAMEVRDREDGSFVLLLKTPRGDVNDIAAFSSRGRAVAALMTISRAMEQAHGQIRPPAANDGDSYNPSRLPVPVHGSGPAGIGPRLISVPSNITIRATATIPARMFFPFRFFFWLYPP